MKEIVEQAISEMLKMAQESAIDERFKKLVDDLTSMGLIFGTPESAVIAEEIKEGLKYHPYYKFEYSN
jgi:hypothetical protein